MPSNARTAKTVPPIIAAAKARMAELKQLYTDSGAGHLLTARQRQQPSKARK